MTYGHLFRPLFRLHLSKLHLSYSCEPLMRLDWQILLKSPPLNLLAGAAPGLMLKSLSYQFKFDVRSTWSDRSEPFVNHSFDPIRKWGIAQTNCVCWNKGRSHRTLKYLRSDAARRIRMGWEYPIGFRVQRCNHSAIAAGCLLFCLLNIFQRSSTTP